MKALDYKLWRDLWMMRGQAFAIALVIVSGGFNLRHVYKYHKLPESDEKQVLFGLWFRRSLCFPETGARKPQV